jgi:hypothetical protein
MPQRLGCRVPFTPASFTMGKVARTWDTRQHELRPVSVKSVGDEDADAKYKQCCNSFEHRAALAITIWALTQCSSKKPAGAARFRATPAPTETHIGNALPGPDLYRRAEGQEWSLCALQFPQFSQLPSRRDACPISLSLPSLRGSNLEVRLLEVRLPPALLYPPSPSAPASTQIDQPPKADELSAAAYQKAAEEILRRAPNSRASAVTNDLSMTGRIPFPKHRPIPRRS